MFSLQREQQQQSPREGFPHRYSLKWLSMWQSSLRSGVLLKLTPPAEDIVAETQTSPQTQQILALHDVGAAEKKKKYWSYLRGASDETCCILDNSRFCFILCTDTRPPSPTSACLWVTMLPLKHFALAEQVSPKSIIGFCD